jgi:hypothetical protein
MARNPDSSDDNENSAETFRGPARLIQKKLWGVRQKETEPGNMT